MAHPSEVTRILTAVAAGFPEYAITKATIALYAAALADIPATVLEAAAMQHVATSRFFPKIAELRELAAALVAAQNPQAPPDAAWEWVARWIGSSGRGRDTTGHELEERAVESIGGWHWLGQRPTDERHWSRKAFIEVYQTLLDRSRWEASLLPAAREMLGLPAPSSCPRAPELSPGPEAEDSHEEVITRSQPSAADRAAIRELSDRIRAETADTEGAADDAEDGAPRDSVVNLLARLRKAREAIQRLAPSGAAQVPQSPPIVEEESVPAGERT